MGRWLLLLAVALALPASSRADPAYTDLRIAVHVGPNRDQRCEIDARLWRPDGVSAARTVPVIMGTTGYGADKTGFDRIALSFAERGYGFLAYTGLGFRPSTCKITFDDRDHDGAAGAGLIDHLAGVDWIRRDGPGDPRVGMLGSSYGGQVQFAVAAVDDRLDTIVPQITWNDLAYSIAPNNADRDAPGVTKLEWPALFLGIAAGEALGAPSPGCPNLADWACPVLLGGAANGYVHAEGVRHLRNASVMTYTDRVRIPTFLIQGQADALFGLRESVDTYRALRAQRTPVKLLWRSAGHGGGDLGNREFDPIDLEDAYESRLVLQWFEHHLRGHGPRPGLDFSFITDWLPAGRDAAPAVGVAPRYPAATEEPLYLSGTNALTSDPAAVRAGAASTLAVPAVPAGHGISYTTQPLQDDLDLVGLPRVTFRVSAPSFANAADPGARLVLVATLSDVAPDGRVRTPRGLVAAARISEADLDQPVTIGLPGLVHRFGAGHRLRLTIATGDLGYRSSAAGGTVTVRTDPADPGVLVLPRSVPRSGPAGSAPGGLTPFGTRPAALLGGAPCRRPRVLRFRLVAPHELRAARVHAPGRVRTLRGPALHRRVSVRVPRAGGRVVVTARARDGSRRRSTAVFLACPERG